jgi:hypothetical protein
MIPRRVITSDGPPFSQHDPPRSGLTISIIDVRVMRFGEIHPSSLSFDGPSDVMRGPLEHDCSLARNGLACDPGLRPAAHGMPLRRITF